jgi:predicted ATPase
MLNSIIKIDLHIHSAASQYKDESIVLGSNVDNVEVLLKNLNENKIGLFSITDHNRFDYNLYSKIKDNLKENNKYGNVKKVLPGIEFDVVLEAEKGKCHIIAIFDDKDPEKIAKIQEKMFSIKKLNDKSDSYSINEFEKILKAINIEVILIVHQKQAIDNTEGDTESLSNACTDPSYFIKVGYIDSLEYNYPRVEGIVKNSLRDIDLDFPLITGSDCHTWKNYPFRSNQNGRKRDFTSFKCLPTFKGLLMSITSFNSRANRTLNENVCYIDNLSINDINYPLSNGLNVIIGDNGSGKSLLLNLIGDGDKTYYDQLVEENKIKYTTSSSDFQKEYINYIEQGEINEKVRDGNLFNDDDDEYYDDIETKDIFAQKIRKYFDDLLKYIFHNIRVFEAKVTLENKILEIKPIDKSFYHPIIKSEISIEHIELDKSRKIALNQIYEKLKLEYEGNLEYYTSLNLKERFKENIDELSNILTIVNQNYKEKNKRNTVRNLIKKHLDNYKTDLDSKRTSEETEKSRIIEKYDEFKKCIIDYIKLEIEKNEMPKFISKMNGTSVKPYSSYEFKKTTAYNNVDLKEPFIQNCFNNKYATEEAISSIKTKDVLSEALKGYNLRDLPIFKVNKIEKFITDWSKESTSISEVSSAEKIGNTPGEISLVYYKFLIQEAEKDFYVLVIDQPEDDINPKRIKDFLLKYLGSIRDKKQVILVTHNPLLVVNLDVDNVIHLTKINNKIEVKSGALEYENEDYSILDLVKNNLDGGYKAIERRLKVYERDEN